MYEHDGWMFFGGGLMWLFWLLIIVAVLLLVRFIVAGGSSSSTKDSALEILKKRYGRGEINDEEYEQRRNKLLS
jgi:putative membrane protein